MATIDYLRRRETYKLETPVELPEDVLRVEVDQYPANEGVNQLRFIFYKADGTTVVKKAPLGKLTETGLTITFA